MDDTTSKEIFVEVDKIKANSDFIQMRHTLHSYEGITANYMDICPRISEGVKLKEMGIFLKMFDAAESLQAEVPDLSNKLSRIKGLVETCRTWLSFSSTMVTSIDNGKLREIMTALLCSQIQPKVNFILDGECSLENEKQALLLLIGEARKVNSTPTQVYKQQADLRREIELEKCKKEDTTMKLEALRAKQIKNLNEMQKGLLEITAKKGLVKKYDEDIDRWSKPMEVDQSNGGSIEEVKHPDELNTEAAIILNEHNHKEISPSDINNVEEVKRSEIPNSREDTISNQTNRDEVKPLNLQSPEKQPSPSKGYHTPVRIKKEMDQNKIVTALKSAGNYFVQGAINIFNRVFSKDASGSKNQKSFYNLFVLENSKRCVQYRESIWNAIKHYYVQSIHADDRAIFSAVFSNSEAEVLIDVDELNWPEVTTNGRGSVKKIDKALGKILSILKRLDSSYIPIIIIIANQEPENHGKVEQKLKRLRRQYKKHGLMVFCIQYGDEGDGFLYFKKMAELGNDVASTSINSKCIEFFNISTDPSCLESYLRNVQEALSSRFLYEKSNHHQDSSTKQMEEQEVFLRKRLEEDERAEKEREEQSERLYLEAISSFAKQFEKESNLADIKVKKTQAKQDLKQLKKENNELKGKSEAISKKITKANKALKMVNQALDKKQEELKQIEQDIQQAEEVESNIDPDVRVFGRQFRSSLDKLEHAVEALTDLIQAYASLAANTNQLLKDITEKLQQILMKQESEEANSELELQISRFLSFVSILLNSD